MRRDGHGKQGRPAFPCSVKVLQLFTCREKRKRNIFCALTGTLPTLLLFVLLVSNDYLMSFAYPQFLSFIFHDKRPLSLDQPFCKTAISSPSRPASLSILSLSLLLSYGLCDSLSSRTILQ